MVGVLVYEKVLPDAFTALLDLCPESEQPMVYFLCLAKSADDVSISVSNSSNALVPARHLFWTPQSHGR
jgi:hypothetical protein